MFTFIVEILSLVLFVGSAWHATRFESRAFAQQWFISAYLYVFIRETITQVWLQTYDYAPAIVRLGAAPAIVGLLWGSVFYLAYQFTRRFTASPRFARVAALKFVIAASLALPIEATAAQLHWWLYTDPGRAVFGGVPISVPLVWGSAAAIFYAVFSKVNSSRLPEQGKLYAMVTLSPAIAAAHLLVALALGFIG
jgi:hypothetical protein